MKVVRKKGPGKYSLGYFKVGDLVDMDGAVRMVTDKGEDKVHVWDFQSNRIYQLSSSLTAIGLEGHVYVEGEKLP